MGTGLVHRQLPIDLAVVQHTVTHAPPQLAELPLMVQRLSVLNAPRRLPRRTGRWSYCR